MTIRLARLFIVLFWVSTANVALAQETGFTPLFDGKTLAGWEGDEKVFRVEDGAIVAGSPSEKIAHNDFLASKEEFSDFDLWLRSGLVGKVHYARVQRCSQPMPNHFGMSGS